MADLRNFMTEFHETWWSYRYMFLVGSKVFSFVVKGNNNIKKKNNNKNNNNNKKRSKNNKSPNVVWET
jgi:hypothetical protein